MACLYCMAAFLLYIILSSTVSGYPYKVQVSKITSISVSLNWESTELLVQEFIIHCSGNQYYQTTDGEVHSSDMHVRSQYVPKGLGHVIIGGLRPNYNYTCKIGERVQEGAKVFNGQLSKPVLFYTDYAAPQEPKVPTIMKEGGVTYITLNKPESLKSGPITGYVIQFHLIPDSSLSDVPIENDRTEPFGKLSPINFDFARVTPQPVSFQIKFKHDLPKHIQIERDLMRGALKNRAVYRVVTIAYIKCKDSTVVFTASKPSVSFVAVGLDRAADESDNESTPSHIKFAVMAGILLPLLCLIYMCCISIVLLCREHYLALKYAELDTRSCIKQSLDLFRRKLLVMYLMCTTCLSCCKKSKKGFVTLPLSDDENFYSRSEEKTFDSNFVKKSGRVDKAMQKGHPNKINDSNRHLHHSKLGHDSSTNRVENQPNIDKYHYKSIYKSISKRTFEDTKAHFSEKYQTSSHITRVDREKHQGIENICLPPKVLPKPLVEVIKKDHFPVPSSLSKVNFTHHHSSRFKPSSGPDHNRQHSVSQDTSRFEHQPSPKHFVPFSTQYRHDNSHVTVQQPTKSPLQHSSDVSPSARQEPVKSTAQNSEHSSCRTPHDRECHSLNKYTSKPNTQHANNSTGRDLSHYQQHSKSASESHSHKMQHNSFIESSGSSISSDDISGMHILHYTTSASGFEKPSSCCKDKHYRPFEFDKTDDDDVLVSTSMFTRSSNSMFIPICSTDICSTDKIHILSSTENFDLISLSSNTTVAGGGELDSFMDF